MGAWERRSSGACKDFFQYLILGYLYPMTGAIVTDNFNTYVNHLANKHVGHVKPFYAAPFDALTFDVWTRETVFREVGGVVGGFRYLIRCLQTLYFSLTAVFRSSRSLFHSRSLFFGLSALTYSLVQAKVSFIS